MRQVEQTALEPGGGGNCVAACVASIFGLPLEECWPAIPSGGDYQAVCRWTDGRYPALHPIHKLVAGHWYGEGERSRFLDSYPPVESVEWPFAPAGFWIASVVSPRGVLQRIDGELKPSLHAVVMYGGEVAWDPHPEREMGIGGVYSAMWWVVRNPGMLS